MLLDVHRAAPVYRSQETKPELESRVVVDSRWEGTSRPLEAWERRVLMAHAEGFEGEEHGTAPWSQPAGGQAGAARKRHGGAHKISNDEEL